MNSNYYESDDQSQYDEIDLGELLSIVWRAKWIVLFVTIIAAVLSTLIAFNMPNIYKAEVLLAPAEDRQGGGIEALTDRLGGIASLAGIKGGSSDVAKISIAIEILRSRVFLMDFIERHEILIPLLAAKDWDQEKEHLVFDEKQENQLANVGSEKDKKSQLWLAYKYLLSMIEVKQSEENGLITVAIEHISPNVAKEWLDWLISDVNDNLRKRDIEEANQSVHYLREQLKKTVVADMQKIFYQLIEQQTQTVMLASVRPEYVFKIIDPPVVPEEKIRPMRGRMILLGSILGLVIGVVSVLFYGIRSERK